MVARPKVSSSRMLVSDTKKGERKMEWVYNIMNMIIIVWGPTGSPTLNCSGTLIKGSPWTAAAVGKTVEYITYLVSQDFFLLLP